MKTETKFALVATVETLAAIALMIAYIRELRFQKSVNEKLKSLEQKCNSIKNHLTEYDGSGTAEGN